MLNNLQIPNELRKKVHKELEAGETIKWVEQPIPRFFTASSISSILLGIPSTSFALFWIWAALGFKFPDIREGIQFQHLFALFGLPFVLIGFGMLSSPIWVWLAARKTVYLITNRRAISIQGGVFTIIRSYLPSELKDIYRKEQANGSGDVVISVRLLRNSDGYQRSEEIGFMGVRNAQETEKMLKQLAQNT
ncbi:hypothetical protein IQ247_28170 [Plectonema cf. radiosum LEGE 06105]|uniref:Uncharacterized protein n=1 Tax=Plectonema cf. radiosum LEGE 06105 TaxID=945769 RepID=A0A8J7FNK3_9CYAN|nr:hypothetical protein [Plectonema radiosum]MBE9216491.1 hypothetical protein [Plectonema cf. radiosum LEGE 06105]